MFPPTWLLAKSKFTLGNLGAAGMFGGDVAVLAMATVHVYENRRWLGWYNSPGSSQIAERYGRVQSSEFFNGFSLGANTKPAALLSLDDCKGPKFRGIYSGTVMETGHLAALFMKECTSLEGRPVHERQTRPIGVTVAHLNHVPPYQIQLKFLSTYTPIFASIPISVSIAACASCGIFQDWYAFAMILLGILANGITCLVIGGARFTFTHPYAAEGSPLGNGILISDDEIVVLKGPEAAVNCIIRGRFSLDFSSKPQYRDIGWCSVLFTIQFIAQLLLIPQAMLFGQIMFIASLAVSWIYNLWLSARNEKFQRKILLENMFRRPVLTKYILGTRTTMAVFVLLVLQITEPSRFLNELLPNDTTVWRCWKDTILQRLADREAVEFTESDWDLEILTNAERLLLEKLYRDAEVAWATFIAYTEAT